MHDALIAIDDDRIVVFRHGNNTLGLPDDGNTHGARHDHHMAGGRPVFQHDTAQAFARIVQKLSRAHGTGNDDRILGQ